MDDPARWAERLAHGASFSRTPSAAQRTTSADSPEELGLMVLVRAAIQLLAREVQEEPDDGEREKSPLGAADD